MGNAGARSRFAHEKAERWSASDDEWVAQAGWDLVGSLAAGNPELPDEYFEERLETADRIGTVEVDHGETGCKTPAARPYIEKVWARQHKAASAV